MPEATRRSITKTPTATEMRADAFGLLGSPAARLCMSAELAVAQIAPSTRNAIPPHVPDENPQRKTKDQDSIDQPVEHGSATLLAMRPSPT